MFPLVLLLAEADPVPEERRDKENSDRPCGSNGSKVVLTLLTEVVAVHMELCAVYVRRAGFQLLLEYFEDDESWDESGSRSGNGNSSLQNDLEDPLQVILGGLGNTSSSGRRRP